MGIAALAFAACSNDELAPEKGAGSSIDSNEPTYVTIRYSLPGNTRSVGTGAGETGGDRNVKLIKDYIVMIFNATTKVLEYSEAVDVPDNSQSAPPAKKILSTPGEKRMYVFGNVKSNTEIYNKINPDVFVPKSSNSTLDVLLDMKYAGLLVNLVPSSGYVMANTDSESSVRFLPNITSTDATGGNDFTFTLTNMASKVGIAYGSASTLVVGSIGEITELKYVLRNIAKESFLIQKSPIQGCYYDWTPVDKTDAGAWAVNFKVPAWNLTNNGGIPIAVVPADVDPDDVNKLFAAKWSLASENVNANPTIGNSTYAAIRGTFTPKEIVDAASWNALTNKVNLTSVSGSANTTFVRILVNTFTDVPEGVFFKTAALAKEALAMATHKKAETTEEQQNAFIEGVHFLTYTDGYCWYRMNIGSGVGNKTTVGVERGKSYSATINNITGVGQNSEEKLDGSDPSGGNTPELPLDQNTYLDVTILAKGWDEISQSGDLN